MIDALRDQYRLTAEMAIVGTGCGKAKRVTIAASEERVWLPVGCRADSVVVDPDYHHGQWRSSVVCHDRTRGAALVPAEH